MQQLSPPPSSNVKMRQYSQQRPVNKRIHRLDGCEIVPQISGSATDQSPLRLSEHVAHIGLHPAFKMEDDGSTRLHVENLTLNIEQAHLSEIFGHYGSVVSVDLPKQRDLSTGYAIICMETAVDALKAQAHLDGGQLDGNLLRVNRLPVGHRAGDSASSGGRPHGRHSDGRWRGDAGRHGDRDSGWSRRKELNRPAWQRRGAEDHPREQATEYHRALRPGRVGGGDGGDGDAGNVRDEDRRE